MLFQENILNGLQGKMNKNPLVQVCDLCFVLKKQKFFALLGQDTVCKTAPAEAIEKISISLNLNKK